MAQGRKAGKRLLLPLVAVSLYAGLLAAGAAPNPFPAIWEWIDRERPLAPDMAWQERLGARPEAASLAGDTVAVQAGSHAEMRARDSGAVLMAGDPLEWPAEWVLPAGSGDDRVVITSARIETGYQVRDADTGELLHEDQEAVAVWTFRDARLDLHCDSGRACRLNAYPPSAATPAWSTDLPGRRAAGAMQGAAPTLAGAGRPDADRIDAAVAGLSPLPRVLGFPVERRSGDAVVVVALATGDVLQVLEPAENERIMVVGDRVVRTETTRRNGVCRASASGFDPVTGARVWGPEPYHLWTDDSGCGQRTPPLSGGAAVAAVGPAGDPLVLDAYDGRVLWSGDPEESIVDLSSSLAVVRTVDEATLRAVPLGGDGEPAWDARAEPDAEVIIGECGVIVADRDPSRVYVRDPQDGEIIHSAPTTATVLACSPDGLVLAAGRSVGFTSFAPAATK